ncbi:MAG: hypothetical protein DME26_14535 [Verrucomicrobia bacterium]|nr:MAG: hypothetical protein DME26_14535 [Verrucomicrobiota bacterium]
MEKPLFCLSWLNGQFKAMAVDRSGAVRSWDRPGLVADFTNFSTVLAEAGQKTRPEGKQVAMVLAHPRLSHQVVEVPPAKGRTLERILQRHVDRLKTFEGPAAWAAQPATPTKNSNALLLHIFPQSLVNELTSGCKQAGLQLVRLLPTTAVLSSQLNQLSLEKDELALVVAETGSATTVVIGGSDGRVCLGRVLRGHWNQQLDSLAVDLTRTIGFAEQQSGRVVSSVWLFGVGAQAHVSALQSALHLPVKLSPVPCIPFYWVEQAAKLPDQDDGNLISLEVREAPQRRRLITATGLILIILLIASLVTAGSIAVLRRGWSKEIEKQDREMARLQGEKTKWQQRYGEFARKRELVRIVLDEKPPPVPAWFLGYLSEAVPEDLLLTELLVVRTNEAWFVKMAGTAQPTTNASPALVFRQAAASMTNRLATGPFHLNINRSVIGESVERTSSPSSAGKVTNDTFLVEGVIR